MQNRNSIRLRQCNRLILCWLFPNCSNKTFVYASNNSWLLHILFIGSVWLCVYSDVCALTRSIASMILWQVWLAFYLRKPTVFMTAQCHRNQTMRYIFYFCEPSPQPKQSKFTHLVFAHYQFTHLLYPLSLQYIMAVYRLVFQFIFIYSLLLLLMFYWCIYEHTHIWEWDWRKIPSHVVFFSYTSTFECDWKNRN